MTYNCLGINRTAYTILFLCSLLAASVTLGSVAVGFDHLASRNAVSAHLV
jgi:hypothetical protein